VTVVNQKPISLIRQFLVDSDKRFGGRALEKRPRGGIERSAQEIVGRRISNIEFDRIVQDRQVHQVRLPEVAFFRWRLGRQGFAAQDGQGLNRLNSKRLSIFAVDGTTLEYHRGRFYLRRPIFFVAFEYQLLPI